MKKMAIFVIVLSALVFSTALTSFAEAGVATVYGKVTEPDGVTPVAGAEVVIAVKRLQAVPVVDFPWVDKVVKTGQDGAYKTSILFPDIVEICFEANVIKADGEPFKRGSKQVNFYNKPPVNKASYRLDASLSSCPNCAVIKGTLTNKETGVPLEIGEVYISATQNPGTTDASVNPRGFYKTLVNLGADSSEITIYGPARTHKNYIYKKITANVKKGKIYTFNLSCMPDKKKGYIYGNVVDANTGKPIPFALVRHCIGGLGGCSDSVTDFLGRYHTPTGGGRWLSTTGAHTDNEKLSPYHKQYKDYVEKTGKSERIDFEMIPK